MRLFVAVQPPPPVIDLLRTLPRDDVPGLRWTPEHTWHVTLRFLGQVDDADPVRDALAATDLGPRVDVQLGPRTRWLNRNVLVLPAAGLDDLAARVTTATAELGEPHRHGRFDGHLTIGRRRRGGRRPSVGVVCDTAFVADEVVLFSSTLSDAGATHEPLARFPLA